MFIARWGYGRTAAFAVVVLLVAVAAGLGLQSSSARGLSTNPPPPKTYTATLAPSCVSAGTTTPLTLTLTNTSTAATLGSVNLSASGSGISLSSTSSSATASGSTLSLRSLGIAPGAGPVPIPIDVAVPAGFTGPITWTITGKSTADFSGASGDTFGLQAPLAPTSVCAPPTLAWGNEPASAKLNTTISDTPYASGNPVTILSTGLPDNTQVTLHVVPGQIDCPSASFTGDTAPIQSGVATFGSLTGTGLGLGCELYAQAGSTTSASSNPFNITLTGITCGTSCQINGLSLPGGTQVNGSGTSSGSFHFFALTSASIPSSVTGPGGGCANFSTLGSTAFDESDGNTSGTGTKTFRYFVPKSDIVKKYSWNKGQPFIPICAGGERVVNGSLVSCTQDTSPSGGWWGKKLDSTGAFTKGGYAQAVCDQATGLWWGILASFQDVHASPHIVQGTTPLVTGWGSGKSSRYFDISVPAPWDWRAGT